MVNIFSENTSTFQVVWCKIQYSRSGRLQEHFARASVVKELNIG